MSINDKYIDVHLHLQDKEYDTDRHNIILEAENKHIDFMFCCSAHERDWEQVAAMSEHYKSIIPFLGIHPWFVDKIEENWDKRLIDKAQKKHCGIGEIGLDRLLTRTSFALQIEIFKKQLNIAKDLRKPVSIHCLSAYGYLLEIIKELKPIPEGSFIHSYSGSSEMIKQFADLGLMFSYNGKALDEKSKRYAKNIKATGIDILLLETDSPFMMPQELEIKTGQSRNKPANLPVFAKEIAKLKSISPSELSSAAYDNSLRILSAINNS
ncbi:MAG: TatD family hydrolase [Sedimentisphaeraceae bacterium JB056]